MMAMTYSQIRPAGRSLGGFGISGYLATRTAVTLFIRREAGRWTAPLLLASANWNSWPSARRTQKTMSESVPFQ